MERSGGRYKMMKNCYALLSRLARNDEGTIALLFGLTIFAMLLTAGLAIDGARYYKANGRVMSTLDSAALAAGQMLDDPNYTDTDIQNQAAGFFQAHWGQNTLNRQDINLLAPVTTIDRNNSQVSVAVTGSIATTLGQVAGVKQFDLSRVSTVTFRQKKIELAMALDTTGSMCQPCSKLDGVKAAANDVVDALLDGTHPPGTMKVAIAPFAASVNAGAYAASVSGGSSADGCVVERSGGGAFTDALATGSQQLNSNQTVPTNSNYPRSGS